MTLLAFPNCLIVPRSLLCPDPSGGTAGQVCARNTAGDAYELVDQSAGG